MSDEDRLSNVSSNCCYAGPQGEVIDGEARCSDCKEMALFEPYDEDEGRVE